MLRLTATFKVSLVSPLFVDRPLRQEGVRIIQDLRYPLRIDNSDVEIALVEAYHAMTALDRDQNILRGPIWAVPRVQVSVSRTETVQPPAIPLRPEGGRNFRDRIQYFHERILIYRKVALEALRRFLRFFKYRQAHALLRDPMGKDLDNPKWTDDTGQEVPSGIHLIGGIHLIEGSLYGIELDDDVGIHALAAPDDPALQQALAEPPIEPELYEELLSDARAALFQGSLRRAILELAISCEIAIKQVFFDKATEAEISEYFDERKQLCHSVGGFTSLLGKPAERILGQNFQKAKRHAYVHVDNLFQCRNQIAHGKVREYTYKNKRGRCQSVNQTVVKEWFKAADHLFHWLRRMRP
jgi:hypothetical protein